jgi:hypothetical protein
MSQQELHPEKMQNNLGHAIIVLKERGRVGAENRIMARTGCTWDEAVYAIGLALRLLPDGWATDAGLRWPDGLQNY